MADITTKVCGVTFESFFKTAVLFRDSRCDEVCQKFLEAFASYGLKPAQVVVKSGDHTFNYEISFSLFNGNGSFKVTSEKIEISLQNATSDKDLEIVQECIAKVYEHVPLPEIRNTSISVSSHAAFASSEAMLDYVSRYAKPEKQIVSGGVIAYILCEKWKEEIRLMIDKSLVYPNSIFWGWSTSHQGNNISRELLSNLKDVLSESVAKLDLNYLKATH